MNDTVALVAVLTAGTAFGWWLEKRTPATRKARPQDHPDRARLCRAIRLRNWQRDMVAEHEAAVAAYESYPDATACCEHLASIELAMRRAGLRVQSGRRGAASAPCCIDMEALSRRLVVPASVYIRSGTRAIALGMIRRTRCFIARRASRSCGWCTFGKPRRTLPRFRRNRR
jgi:hypothetical protein